MFEDYDHFRTVPESKLQEDCQMRVLLKGTDDWPLGQIVKIKETSDARMYYIHYINFNRRLDGWVDVSSLDLTSVRFPKKDASPFNPCELPVLFHVNEACTSEGCLEREKRESRFDFDNLTRQFESGDPLVNGHLNDEFSPERLDYFLQTDDEDMIDIVKCKTSDEASIEGEEDEEEEEEEDEEVKAYMNSDLNEDLSPVSRTGLSDTIENGETAGESRIGREGYEEDTTESIEDKTEAPVERDTEELTEESSPPADDADEFVYEPRVRFRERKHSASTESREDSVKSGGKETSAFTTHRLLRELGVTEDSAVDETTHDTDKPRSNANVVDPALLESKNVELIEIGKYRITPWYFSPYPEELIHLNCIYICEFCLKYVASRFSLERHLCKCLFRHPPGNEIYRKDNLSFFEVDGRKAIKYCRNLCLLSKLFLDHKTLYYDIDPFMFYVLCECDNRGYHIVGYFSKEKESFDNNNLACILTLPPYQKKGYGNLMIDMSYQISRVEGKIGSPEKPLSDLGLLSYRSYWTNKIMEIASQAIREPGVDRRHLSVAEISKKTFIKKEDIISTLQSNNMLNYHRGNPVLVLTPKNVQNYQKTLRPTNVRLDLKCVKWPRRQYF